MVTFNLLPWREYQYQYEKRICQRLWWMSVLCSFCLLMGWYRQLQHQEAQLTTQVMALKPLLKPHKKLTSRSQRQTTTWYKKNSTAHTLFTHLGEAYAGAVCLTAIKRENNSVVITGEAGSALDVATFLAQWPHQHGLTQATVQQLKQTPAFLQFRLQAQ